MDGYTVTGEKITNKIIWGNSLLKKFTGEEEGGGYQVFCKPGTCNRLIDFLENSP